MTAADFAIVPDADAPQVIWITWAGGRRPVHIREDLWQDTRYEIQPGSRGFAVIVTERRMGNSLVRSRAVVHQFDDAAVSHVTPWWVREKKLA